MAKAILEKMVEENGLADLIQVDSAGTWALDGNPPAENSEEVCLENDLYISEHRSKHVTSQLMDSADLVLCMEPHHKRDLLSIFPQYASKVFTLREFGRPDEIDTNGIPDPIGRRISAYRKTFKLLTEEIERIFPLIKQMALESRG